MSRHALEALHRVAREVGVSTQQLSDHIARDLCAEYHRLRTENTSLAKGIERANHRLNILEGLTP